MLIANPNSYRESWTELASFRRKLTALGKVPTYVEVTDGFAVAGEEQARLWGGIEDFLAKHLLLPGS